MEELVWKVTCIAHGVFDMWEILVVLLKRQSILIAFHHSLENMASIAMERPTLKYRTHNYILAFHSHL